MNISRVFQGTYVILMIVYNLIYGLDVSYNYVKQFTGCVVDKYIFLKLIKPSLDKCVVECVRRPGCLAANFRPRFTLCSLVNNNNLVEIEWSKTEKDCVFVNKSDMHFTIPSHFEQCEAGQNLDLEKVTCSKTVPECPKLSVANGTVLGNMNGIGTRAKYTCNPGFKREPDDSYTVCQANGTWSITPNCKELCEKEWVYYNNSCYMFGTKDRNFSEARDECISHGAILVHVDDSSENDFIKQHLLRPDTPAYGGNFWLGLIEGDHVQSTERIWKWADINTNATFLSWFRGEPSTDSEHCVILYKENNNPYGWHDVDCGKSFKSLCEKGKN